MKNIKQKIQSKNKIITKNSDQFTNLTTSTAIIGTLEASVAQQHIFLLDAKATWVVLTLPFVLVLLECSGQTVQSDD